MKRSLSAGAAALLFSAAAASAQAAPPAQEVGLSLIASTTITPKSSAKMSVGSPAFAASGDIPFENTQYKGNMFPGLFWTAGPPGTTSYVVILQDADAMRNGAPILHWTMVNIPANVLKLDPAMSAPPAGAQYGPNIRAAAQPYLGPRTPAGPKHRYHFQVFALDTSLSAESQASYATLTDAMKGHVLAMGEVIGLGQIMPTP